MPSKALRLMLGQPVVGRKLWGRDEDCSLLKGFYRLQAQPYCAYLCKSIWDCYWPIVIDGGRNS
jgi:hypothetical protein